MVESRILTCGTLQKYQNTLLRLILDKELREKQQRRTMRLLRIISTGDSWGRRVEKMYQWFMTQPKLERSKAPKWLRNNTQSLVPVKF